MPLGGGGWVGGVGGPNEIEKVTVNYTWNFMTPLLRPFFPGGQINLTVDSAMKNEEQVQLKRQRNAARASSSSRS